MSANWWGISASIVAWLGVAVIALAIIGPWIKQRIKRRRRCPKCWYDMSHSPPPAMTCSECGFTAKRERRLYKARRRWKLAFLGVFLLIGAYALHVTPAVKDRGWPAAVPTTALILALPWYESRYSRSLTRGPLTPILNRMDHKDRYFHELIHYRMLSEEGMSRFNRRLMLRRCLAGDSARPPLTQQWNHVYGAILQRMRQHDDDADLWERAEDLVDVEFVTRQSWPEGVPIHAGVRVRHWRGPWAKHTVTLEPRVEGLVLLDSETGLRKVMIGIPESGTFAYDVTIRYYDGNRRSGLSDKPDRIRNYQWRPQIGVGGRIEDHIRIVDEPAIGDVLKGFMRPLLRSDPRMGNHLVLFYEVRLPADATSLLLERTLGLSLQILRDGAVVGEGEVFYRPVRYEDAGEEFWTLKQQFDGARIELDPEHAHPILDPAEAHASQWSLRIIGDPEVALRDYRATQCWRGEITVPMIVEFE